MLIVMDCGDGAFWRQLRCPQRRPAVKLVPNLQWLLCDVEEMTIFIYSVETISRILMFFWDSYKYCLLINLKCYELCVSLCVMCVQTGVNLCVRMRMYGCHSGSLSFLSFLEFAR